MFLEKENVYVISTEGLVFGVDYEVITSTVYEEGDVSHFIKIVDHEIDMELVYKLGLGVVGLLDNKGDYYLYNASKDGNDGLEFMREMVRFQVYYQLTHPDDVDGEFAEFAGIERGQRLIHSLFASEAQAVYENLQEIFTNNSDKSAKIIPFPQK